MTNGHINPANVPDIALKDGHSIPQVGLGVLRIDDEGVVPVVESALEAGYRHIDGAAGYNNEAGVGRALAASGYNKGTKRETLWVTTKLRDSQQGYDSALKAFDNSLKLLQLDYVDMYMIHWPTPFDWRSTDLEGVRQAARRRHGTHARRMQLHARRSEASARGDRRMAGRQSD